MSTWIQHTLNTCLYFKKINNLSLINTLISSVSPELELEKHQNFVDLACNQIFTEIFVLVDTKFKLAHLLGYRFQTFPMTKMGQTNVNSYLQDIIIIRNKYWHVLLSSLGLMPFLHIKTVWKLFNSQNEGKDFNKSHKYNSIYHSYNWKL